MALPAGAKLVPGRFGRACGLSDKQALKAPVKNIDGGRGVLSMWVNFDRLVGEQTLCQVQGGGDGLKLMLKAHTLHFQLYDAARKTWTSATADVSAWKAGAWHQVGAYWDANFQVMRIAVDGRMAGKSALGFTPAFGAATVWIGADQGLRGLAGAVDEVAIRQLGK